MAQQGSLLRRSLYRFGVPLLNRSLSSSNRWVAAAGFALFALGALRRVIHPKGRRVSLDLARSGPVVIRPVSRSRGR